MLTAINKNWLLPNIYLLWAQLAGAGQWGPTLNPNTARNLRCWQSTLQAPSKLVTQALEMQLLEKDTDSLSFATEPSKTQFCPETRVLMLLGQMCLWSSILSDFISKKMVAGVRHTQFNFSQICREWFWWRIERRNFDVLKYEVKDFIINEGRQTKEL